MRKRITTITDVAERHLCTGCGMCAHLDDGIEMVDDLHQGRRPLVAPGAGTSSEVLDACPGVGLRRTVDPDLPVIDELLPAWGPVVAMWEGHAGDQEIRHAASSGGAASALALHAIERREHAGLLHITARPDVPYLNHTVFSTTRAEILAATGSRYAPASPCDRLDLIEAAPARSVFIGKPCDVAATAEARRRRPELDAKLGLTVAVFCAGTPSTHGTLEMIRAVGADPERVTSVRYRGNGWPGLATIDEDTPDGPRRHQITYQESWGELLQMHRQWRCYVCMDHTGEFADVAVGDPWYRTLGDDEIGESLVLARTERGREAVEAAIADGYLVAEPAAADLLPRSQPNLLRDRGAVWARTTTTRVMGAPTPRYANLPGFRFWRSEGGLDAKARAQSFYGTVKRVFVKGLYSRRPVVAYDPSPERADHPTAS